MSAALPRLPAPSRFWLRAGLPLAVLLLLLGIALAAPLVAPYSPETQNLLARLKPPGFESRRIHYWLGSDELGRDLLSRLIWGARVSLVVAAASVVLSCLVGTTLGMVAGYRRGVVEMIVMRIVDVFMSIPAILLAIILVAILKPGLGNVIVVLALTRWPRYARVAYAQTLAVAGQPYVRLSRFMGAGMARVLFRHILPNISGALTVVMTLEFGQMVLFEAGLSFLGLGAQPPTPSWGAMLSAGRNYVSTAWWIASFPGLCLFVLVLAANLLGDTVRDRLDPQTQRV